MWALEFCHSWDRQDRHHLLCLLGGHIGTTNCPVNNTQYVLSWYRTPDVINLCSLLFLPEGRPCASKAKQHFKPMNWAGNYVCVLRTCKRSFAFSDCDHFVFLLRYFFFVQLLNRQKSGRERVWERERERYAESLYNFSERYNLKHCLRALIKV